MHIWSQYKAAYLESIIYKLMIDSIYIDISTEMYMHSYYTIKNTLMEYNAAYLITFVYTFVLNANTIYVNEIAWSLLPRVPLECVGACFSMSVL